MKTLKFFTLNIALLLLIAGTMTFVSCGGDVTGPPEITGVRVTNPNQADSTFVKAPAGRMIVIVGKNLQNAKKIFINEQEVFFNANYNTSTHIILSIPSEEDGFVLIYSDPELKSEIRVETDHGTATYNFFVTYPFPEITMIEAEEYPTPTGDKIKVTGYNFLDIKKVYFTNVNTTKPTEGEERIEINESDYTVVINRYLDKKSNRYINESVMEFLLPELPRGAEGNYFGYLAIECAASTVFRKFSTLPDPLITMLSSDMPIPGQKLIVEGLYFVDVKYVDINDGEIVIPVEDMLEVSRTKLSFIMPAKPSKRCDLKVVAPHGEGVRKNFYPYECLLTDFDEIGHYEAWNDPADGISGFREATPAEAPFFSDGQFAWMKQTVRDENWWGAALAMTKTWIDDVKVSVFPSFDYIQANTPSSEVYLAYECYNKEPFKPKAFVRYEFLDMNIQGAFNYFLYDWGTKAFKDVAHPGYDGEAKLNEWYTVYVPLSKFEGFEAASYADIVEQGLPMFHFVVINPDGGGIRCNIDIMYDNVRFVTIPKNN